MMIAEVDEDGGGEIEFDEFLQLMAKKMRQQDAEEEIIESFKVLDKDGQGYLTREQLYHFMTTIGDKLTHDEANEMLNEADKNGDGQIDFEEFAKMMMKP